MSVEANKALVVRGWESAGSGDLDGLAEMYTADVLYHGAAGEEIRGREAVVEMIGGYLTAFPDMTIRVEDVIGEGDRVFSRVRVTGTNTGELMGMPATGKPVDIRWMFNAARFEDGKVAEEWEIFDRMDMMTQLGHVTE
jgi:steroid delta-isomerase-like uncharacterized protein